MIKSTIIDKKVLKKTTKILTLLTKMPTTIQDYQIVKV